MWNVVHSPALANTDKNVKDNNFGFKLKHSKIKSILYDQREKKKNNFWTKFVQN